MVSADDFRRSVANGRWLLDPVEDDPSNPDQVIVTISFQPEPVRGELPADEQAVFEEVCRSEIKRVTNASEKVFPKPKTSAALAKLLQTLASHKDKDGRNMADRVAIDTCTMLGAVDL